MRLNQISDNPGSRKGRMRIGRGIGSGKGKTGGRGVKGQKSRAGVAIHGYEGGQMPLHRRLPKRGFTNIFRTEFAIVNVATLERLEGDSFDPQSLLKAGVIHKLKDGLKILGSGDLKRKITVKAHVFSASALEKIQAAGGTAEVIQKPATAAEAAPKTAAKKKK